MKTKRRTTKRPAKRSTKKFYIPPFKGILLTAAIFAVCAMLLLLAKLPGDKKTPETEQVSITQRFKDNDKTTSEPSKKTSEPETIKQEKPEIKTEPEKMVQKPQPEKPVQQKPSTEKPKPQEPKPQKPEAVQKPVETKPTEKSFDFPQAVNNAQLIFVFDDGGQNLSQLDKFLVLPFPITVAVMPGLKDSAGAAYKVRKSGNEVILHQPMQSIDLNINPGPGAITPDMDTEQIKAILFKNIQEIGPIQGMNNHEGSLITADAEKMETILKFASDNELYFLDSRTNVKTQVPYVSQQLGFSWYERNIFLDNTKTKENALAELKKGLNLANKNGFVIMIGHIWSADFLPAFLKEAYPELKAKGYTFSVVSKSKGKKR